jgi:hypothetical protein
MNPTIRAVGFRKPLEVLLIAMLFPFSEGIRGSDEPPQPSRAEGRKLGHEEALRWVAEHKAWRPARKTRPIWARQVAPEEVGREFQTADHVKQVAREGAWLCVGSAGEPWFQALEKIEAKYEPSGEETRKFGFEGVARRYRIYKPKAATRNWAAQVKGPGIEGFFIRPGYDPERPLYSPAGGYVVMDDVPDPYRASPKDVWLVQKELFESTYELLPESKEK